MKPVIQHRDHVSERQLEYLAFIRDYEDMHGRPPTFREIAIGMDISSKGSISAIVNALARQGFIDKANGHNRGTHVRPPVQVSR